MRIIVTGTLLLAISVAISLVAGIFLWTTMVKRIDWYSQNLADLEKMEAENALRMASDRFDELARVSKKEVLFLKGILETDLALGENLSRTARRFSKLMASDSAYVQVAYITKDRQEGIRVDAEGQNFPMENPEGYQSGADHAYFEKTRDLADGEIFVSPLHWNGGAGTGDVSIPTVRFCAPVFVEDEKAGVVLLDLAMGNWLNRHGDIGVGLLDSQGRTLSGRSDALVGDGPPDLQRLDAHGHPEFYAKTISFGDSNAWTVYTMAGDADKEAKIQWFHRITYRYGGMLFLGMLLLIAVANILYRRQLKIARLNGMISKRIEERDTLIKEIHHRVKNNLQVVASLLSLQGSFIRNKNIRSLFRYGQYRINSMGMVHEMLYRSEDLNRIDYAGYVRELVNSLLVSMKGAGHQIRLLSDIDNIRLNIDTSIPLGLMINEIVTNALKYGFKDTNEGAITIEIDQMAPAHYKMYIGDNGNGFPSSVNFRNAKSMGLRLIHKLVLQLRGNIEKDNSKSGTYYIVTFQEIEPIR